jgi:FK506-binding protein 4/5
MHRGEEATIWCPVSLAVPGSSRGSSLLSGPPPLREIKGNDDEGFPWLEYVEMTVYLHDFRQVRDLSGDGRAMKRIVESGRGEFPADCPLDDTTVRCKVRVRNLPSSSGDWNAVPGSTGADGGLEIATGMDAVPPPVEAALRLMLRGEVASVRCDWAYAYADRIDAPDEGVVRKEGEIEFEVELIDFDPIPNWAALDGLGKLELAGKWREQGNLLFRLGRYKLARQKYLKGIRCVDQAFDLETDDELNGAKGAKLACLVNLAACAQKEEEWGEVIKWCDKALG